MSENICLDANIFIAYFSPDEHNIFVAQLFEKLTEKDFLISVPALTSFEVFNILTKKEVKKEIANGVTLEALKIYLSLPLLLFWKEDLLKEAIRLQKQGIRTFYDASYLALSLLRDIPLITEDKELLKKGKKFYPGIFSPKEWIEMQK